MSTVTALLLSLPGLSEDWAASPRRVNELLATRGGPATVRVLFEQESAWDAVLDGVASGKRDWLLVAQRLAPFTDAHSAETLAMAIEEALARAPESTLELFGSSSCRGVGFTGAEPESLAQVLAAIDKRRRALKSVRKSSLAAEKENCLRLLEVTEKAAPSWDWLTKE